MTTDPFTTADDRWDESPHHLADHCEHAGVGKACRRCRRKFDASAQWARTYLAEQEPTDAERAVRKLHMPRDEQVIVGDCSTEECEHEDGCPTVPVRVCTECAGIAEEGSPYYAENGIEFVAYPCRTIRTLSAARAVGRDAR